MTRYAHPGSGPGHTGESFAGESFDGYGPRPPRYDGSGFHGHGHEHGHDDRRYGYAAASAPSARSRRHGDTLARLAQLRSTISDIQSRGRQDSRTETRTITAPDAEAYDGRRPSPPASSVGETSQEEAIRRILRRRDELDAGARSGRNRPARAQDGRRAHAVQDREMRSRGDRSAALDFSALRRDVSERLDSHLSAIDARVEKSLSRPDNESIEAALRGLSERFDAETRRNARQQGEEETRLSRAVTRNVSRNVSQSLDAMAEQVSARIEDTMARADAHLRERGHEMGEENRQAYEQILSGIGALTDAVTDRLENPSHEADAAAFGAGIEAKIDALTQIMTAVERNVNDAPVLRRVEQDLRTILDPTRGLEARLEARLAPRLDALDARVADRSNTLALAEIDAKIERLAGQVMEASASDPEGTARIEQELVTLQDLVWQTSRESEDSLKQLAARLGEAQPGDAVRPILASIEERLDAVQARLAGLGPQDDARDISRYAEEQIDTLVTRIEALVAGGAAGEVGGEVASQIAALTDRVEALIGRQDGHGPTRDEIVEAMQAAAEDILQRALNDTRGDTGGQAAAAAVAEGLAELRSAQEIGEKRTVDALETVRHTVERVFSRLEALEAPQDPTSRDQAPAAPAAPPSLGAHMAPDAAQGAGLAGPIAVAAEDDASSFAVGDRLREARETIAQDAAAHDMPDDWAPLPPGQGGAGTPAPVAASLSALGAAPTRADFIAAARRAAQQQAETEAEEASPESAAEAPKAGVVRRLLTTRGVRPTLLAAAAIVLALGTLKLVSDAVTTRDLALSPVAETVVGTEDAEIAESLVAPPAAMPNGETAEPRGADVVERETFEVPIEQPVPDVNVARLDAMPEIGEARQFAPRDVANAGLLAPEASMPEAGQLDPPAHAASVQSALANDPTAPAEAVRQVAPEASLLAALPETVGPEPLRVAAASGDAKAQYEIARRYSAGIGVEKDEAAAVTWLERAATQDLAPAQYRLGSMYEKGTGVEKDASLARAWYERAAARGNARAMHNTGVLYAEGALGEVDFEEAVTWFEKAARLGVPDSQFNLGIIYGRGLGVPQDLMSSYMWFDASAKIGDADASAKRDEVASVMEPDAIARAKAMSEALTIAEPDAEANVVALPAELTGGEAAEQAQVMTEEEQAMLIKQVQAVLTHRGFDVGPIDGIPGGRTAKAIQAFQEKNGLDPTGHIDQPLLDALSNG